MNLCGHSVAQEIVAACLETRTWYIDFDKDPRNLTAIITKFDQTATEMGVVIMPCCGTDEVNSILMQLSTYF